MGAAVNRTYLQAQVYAGRLPPAPPRPGVTVKRVAQSAPGQYGSHHRARVPPCSSRLLTDPAVALLRVRGFAPEDPSRERYRAVSVARQKVFFTIARASYGTASRSAAKRDTQIK